MDIHPNEVEPPSFKIMQMWRGYSGRPSSIGGGAGAHRNRFFDISSVPGPSGSSVHCARQKE